MGNSCLKTMSEDKQIHDLIEISFEMLKKELLACIRAELTQSRSNPSSIVQMELNVDNLNVEQSNPPLPEIYK